MNTSTTRRRRRRTGSGGPSLVSIFCRLSTKDGESYFLWERRDEVVLSHKFGVVTKPTLARLLFTLGGMVDWDQWDDDSRLILSHLNGGRGAI